MSKKATIKSNNKNTGEACYLNKNCWLVKNLNSSPYRRCQYCNLKFSRCLFLQYQIISIILILFSFSLLFFVDKSISTSTIIIVFVLVIVYGYFFNNSTEKIIKASFFERKAKEELKELSDKLEDRVLEQTRDIKEKNEHLQELLNMKSDFLRTVNHQLNTPLSIMRNACSMMQDGSLPYKEGMNIASSGLERMSSTISEFWDAFELEGQKIKMDLLATDIEKIIENMVCEKKNLNLVSSRKLKLRIKQPKFKIPKVLCDHKKITHVVSNLLDNAVFYTHNGFVEVSFEKITKNKNNYLKVLISDSGVGIAKEDIKKLFVKFSRGSTATSIHPDGSGLGLYIAKNIVEDSGGELRLESSEINRGTVFSFILKIANDEDIPKTDINIKIDKSSVKKSKSKKYSVLFIEDEQSIVDLYRIYFKRFAYNFYSTDNLNEAKTILNANKIDVIILDIILKKKEDSGMINMVAEQGYEFLKQIKKVKKFKNIPIVVFTSLNTDKDREKAKKLGANNYLFKGSAKPQDLVDAIERVV